MKRDREEDALRILAKYHANGTVDDLVRWEMTEIKNALALEDLNDRSRFIDFLKTPGNRKRLSVLLSLCVGLNWVGNGIIA